MKNKRYNTNSIGTNNSNTNHTGNNNNQFCIWRKWLDNKSTVGTRTI